MSCLLSFGHGYSAQALTRLLVPQGWQVIGTTRSPEKASKLVEEGVEAIVWPEEDATSGALGEAFKRATHLLISAGPEEEGGDPVLARLTPEIMRLAAQLEWAGYLSTTGVYGDHKGAWVDESTPLNPATFRGQLRVDAEAAWAAIPDLPLHIFRLAGIYGPGRGPFAKVRSGTARRIIKPGQVFSRIHVEDIAQVLAASIARPNPGAIYNVCDDNPAPPEDVIGFAAELLNLPLPPAVDFETAEMTEMARSFYAESKRTDNARLSRELGVRLLYPDYKTGLTALFNAESV